MTGHCCSCPNSRCHAVTEPPQVFPPARESGWEESLPMWLFWTYVALLVGLIVATIWTALT